MDFQQPSSLDMRANFGTEIKNISRFIIKTTSDGFQ